MGVIKRLIRSMRLAFEILGVLQTCLWLGGISMTSVGVVALVRSLPIIAGVGLCALGIVFLAYASVKTVIRYKAWARLETIPALDDVLRKALDIHTHLTMLSEQVIKDNKKKNVKTKIINRLAEKYLEVVGIPKRDLPLYISTDGTISRKLYRRVKGIWRLKDGEYFTILPLLNEYGRLLDKCKLGLKPAITSSNEFDSMRGEFLALQLKLNVPPWIMNDINNLPQLSLGLNSLLIGMNLVNPGRSWYKALPEGIIRQQEESQSIVDRAYMFASMWLKNRVRRATFRVNDA